MYWHIGWALHPKKSSGWSTYGWITTHFHRIEIFKAPEQQFKQLVLFGVRRRTKEARLDATGTKERLLSIVNGEQEPETLPECWASEPYVVPQSPSGDVKFNYVKLDTAQLADEINRNPCLWDQFDLKFRSVALETSRRPLRKMSDWHPVPQPLNIEGLSGSERG